MKGKLRFPLMCSPFLVIKTAPAEAKLPLRRFYSCSLPNATVNDMTHYFYLARCNDESLYAGTCIDLEEREAKHNAGTGAKYTRSRLPVRIIYHEEFTTLSEARKREAEVKKLSKAQKENLVIP